MYLAPACTFWLAIGSAALEYSKMQEEGAFLLMAARPLKFLTAAAMGFMVNSLAYIVIQTASSLTLKVCARACVLSVCVSRARVCVYVCVGGVCFEGERRARDMIPGDVLGFQAWIAARTSKAPARTDPLRTLQVHIQRTLLCNPWASMQTANRVALVP